MELFDECFICMHAIYLDIRVDTAPFDPNISYLKIVLPFIRYGCRGSKLDPPLDHFYYLILSHLLPDW